MKKDRVHILTMIAGLLVAASVLCTNIFYQNDVGTAEGATEQTSQDQSDEDYTFKAAPTISLPSSSNVHIILETYCLFEILGTDVEERFDSSDFSLNPQRFLSTLLTVIISPNAP
jgi:hypothetical protein